MKLYSSKKIILLVSVFLMLIQCLYATPPPSYKVTLKTGEVYVGEIIVQNDEILLIRTSSGERFQFPVSSIKSVTKISEEPKVIEQDTVSSEYDLPEIGSQNFCGILEVTGGLSHGKNSFPNSASGEASLSFGTRNIGGKTLFAGLGAGYSFVNIATTSEILQFIPLFVRLQSNNLSTFRTSPYLSLDAGYALALKKPLRGGAFTKLSAGIVHRLNYKNSINFGLYARVQHFEGALKENLFGSEYKYTGNTAIIGFGALAGFQF